jgi:hypothetical protein
MGGRETGREIIAGKGQTCMTKKKSWCEHHMTFCYISKQSDFFPLENV